MWWKRFKPNRSTLPAAAIAALLSGVCLLLIWTPAESPEGQISRYGNALAQTLAHANAGLLLHQQRIELAVIANQVSQLPEVAGVAFYGVNNEIIALAGSTDAFSHFTAAATLDDTITGYVTLIIDPAPFAPPSRPGAWLLSVLALILAPLLSLGIMQLSARGNRSLPIVSVPEPRAAAPQPTYCLVVNLYNQLALSPEQRNQSIADAQMLAMETCAIHHGVIVEVAEHGVMALFDRSAVTPGQAVCAAFLLQFLLSEFDTDGEFRSYLCETHCADAPGEMHKARINDLGEDFDLDTAMMVASLAKPETVMLAPDFFEQLGPEEQQWARPYVHPLMQDMQDEPDARPLYLVDELPPQQAELVRAQAGLILGFSQASA